MKNNINWGALIGGIVISIGLVISSFVIANSIGFATENRDIASKDYLTPEQAAYYCGLDVEDLSCFDDFPDVKTVINGKTVYWREVLIQCMNSQFVK